MQHSHWSDGRPAFPLSKAVCIGRNYAEHAKELGNDVPTTPLFFMKPSTAFVPMDEPISIPSQHGEVHYEAEIAILIGEPLTHASDNQVETALVGVGAALDLTLREIQGALKSKGHPWEKAKAFDGSCPISAFQPISAFSDLQNIDLTLKVNGAIRQQGNSAQMIFPVLQMIQTMSTFFTLLPGDIVLTGTPAGVSPLQPGDTFDLIIGDRIHVQSCVKTH